MSISDLSRQQKKRVHKQVSKAMLAALPTDTRPVMKPKYLAYIIPIICKNWERFK